VLASAIYSIWSWLRHLGGVGLIALGIADASVIPLPGSMDALTIVLAASKRDSWWYYAIMATVGAVSGGYLTYKLGMKGGKESLEKKFPKDKLEKVYKRFEKGGFWTIFIAALLPPPVPMVPFLLAPGALEYPQHKFLAALSSARAIRYFALAYLASIYGRQIIGWLKEYYTPILWTFVGLAVLGGLGAYFYWRHRKKQDGNMHSRARRNVAA
jgi:membrane protein YqaA with SNARE-associated domain